MVYGKDSDGNIRYYKTIEDRFWAKVDIKEEDECWNWKAKTRSGYGRVFYPDRYKEESAHRISWAITFGSIPKGLWVLHDCDNRLCCNPSHLHVGTQLDNIRECVERNQHSTPYQKLSITERRLIKDIYNKGGISQYKLADKYNVSQATIYRCVNGRKDNVWKEYV